MNLPRILELLQEVLPVARLEVQTMPIDEHSITLPPDNLHAAVRALLERSHVYHLSTITGQDVDGQIELLYHFWEGGGLTLRTSLPREQTSVETITDLIPGASFYEREIAEMLQVTFVGHPNLQRLLLPDDWTGGPPLRYEFTLPDDREEGE
jgi:NADH-quinone oxidoreductase subunit C